MTQRPRRRRRLRSPSPSPSPPQPRARQSRKAGAAARGVKPSFALLSARCRRAVASDFGTTVLFGWVAECLTTCFVPAAVTSTGVDVSSVLLNVVGAMLGGVALGVQESESGGRFSLQTRRMATLFRGGFVGVFTSWSWVMEHALHIATAKGGNQTSVLPQLPRAAHGALFVLGSISSGLVAARAGFAVGASCARVDTKRRKRSSTKLAADPAYGVLCALALFTAACVMRVSLSMTGSEAFPSGFAASSDKTAPSSLHRDAHELLVGLMFATLALAVGDHVGGFPDYVPHDTVEWGILRCNTVACACVLLVKYLEPPGSVLLWDKFTASFCGALSAFGSTSDDTVRLWRHGKMQAAMANIALNACVVLLCLYIWL